jgi:hypothetical protein
VPPFYEAKFCGVPSRAIANVGCAVGKERLRNTSLFNNYNVQKLICVVIYLKKHKKVWLKAKRYRAYHKLPVSALKSVQIIVGTCFALVG